MSRKVLNQNSLRDPDHQFSTWHKCPYCKRWECSCYELMRRRGPFCFYAFDLLWLDGSDLRGQPLSERKALLRKLLPRKPVGSRVRPARRQRHGPVPRDLRAGHGGIVAKQASAGYTPDATTW
jgi:ATP-dependent DNA ligase